MEPRLPFSMPSPTRICTVFNYSGFSGENENESENLHPGPRISHLALPVSEMPQMTCVTELVHSETTWAPLTSPSCCSSFLSSVEIPDPMMTQLACWPSHLRVKIAISINAVDCEKYIEKFTASRDVGGGGGGGWGIGLVWFARNLLSRGHQSYHVFFCAQALPVYAIYSPLNQTA